MEKIEESIPGRGNSMYKVTIKKRYSIQGSERLCEKHHN